MKKADRIADAFEMGEAASDERILRTGNPEVRPELDHVTASIFFMSQWHLDADWLDEKPSEFPLLDICPEAPAYFAKAAHFSQRDLKTVAAKMDLAPDVRDPEAIYRTLIERSSEHPWIFSALEMEVGTERIGKKASIGKNAIDRMQRVANKLPLQKLRLETNEELHGRVSEILGDQVAADIAVATFCEYAIQAFYKMLQDFDSQEIQRNAMAYLSDGDDTAKAEAILGNYDGITDLSKHVAALLDIAEHYPDAISGHYLDHLSYAIADLSSGMDSSAPLREFQEIASLSAIAVRQAELLQRGSRDSVEKTLKFLKVEFDREVISNSTVELLATILAPDTMEMLREAAADIDQALEELADVRSGITEASAADDFSALGDLSRKAKALKQKLETKQANRDRLRDLLAAIAAGDREAVATFIEIFHANDDLDFAQQEEGLNGLDAEDEILHETGVAPEASEADYEAPEADEIADETPTLEVEESSCKAEVDFAQDTDAVVKEAPAEAEEASLVAEPAPVEAEGVQAPDLEPAPVSEDVLVDLVSRDLLGIAADAAEAFEAAGTAWPIEATALRTAAASRARLREYGQDMQRFQTIAMRSLGVRMGDLGSGLTLGALVRPAILQKSLGIRTRLPDLCRGGIGKALQEIVEAISNLEYDFPPSADEMARLSGSQRAPQKERIASELADWCDASLRKTSRWPFATKFMHHVASEDGLIGAASAAISRGDPRADAVARKAIESLASQSEIKNCSTEFATATGKHSGQLYPKGLEYLEQRFDVPLGLLDGWIRAREREGSGSHQSEARMRSNLGNLQSRTEKAITELRANASTEFNPVETAVREWIAVQLEDVRSILRGEDGGSFATLEDALTAERDLLPASARDTNSDPVQKAKALTESLNSEPIPKPVLAFERACAEGAFDAGFRLASRFDLDDDGQIREYIVAFAAHWRPEIELRERRLRGTSKVDYNHQEDLARRINWCEMSLTRIASLEDGSEIHDLADIEKCIDEIDCTVGEIETKIREDQSSRIAQYRNDQNQEDADALIESLGDLTIEAIEDRIAQLRDGRSAATFEIDLEGLVPAFTPEFVRFAASASWPRSIEGFKAAIADEGLLHIEEDRRAAGFAFISLYCDVSHSLRLKKPVPPKVRELFEEIGFESVKLHDMRRVGRSNAWSLSLSAQIRSDGWFLPPTFGSKATAGYRLLMVGPDVLPETILKALSADQPSIILLSGTADLARRHELAERLREAAAPALLIDEALVAFAATRRDTRARTIFECGLPYGRVEPYITDAGQLPPEMFFGRQGEMRKIVSRTADGCLVYGGRQLGKSALLGHVARLYNDPANDRIVVRREVKSLGNAEQTEEIWSHIAAMVGPEVVKPGRRSREDVVKDIRTWLTRRRRGQIVCMFDEADHFMDADTRNDYPELSRLKELMEDTDRAFKVVFAGLHNVQRVHKQPNSPLAHLGEPVCIGPLNRSEDDKRAAYGLLINPMRAAGFRFETREAVEQVLAWANYYPSLVQEYAKGLLSYLHGVGSGKGYKITDDGPLWTIQTTDLFKHRGFDQIESRVRDKFQYTLDLDPRYALVAYTLAHLNAEGNEQQALVTGYLPEELLEEAKAFWPQHSEVPNSAAAFVPLLDELFDLGVLGRDRIGRTKGFRYMLRTREVVTMLGTAPDIDHALVAIADKDPTLSYDRSIYRRRYQPAGDQVPSQNNWPYAALTDLQIERLLDPEADQPQIICGLEALGLSKVETSLRRIAETGRLPGAPEGEVKIREVNSTIDLRKAINLPRISGYTANIVFFRPGNGKEAKDVISWTEKQPGVIARYIRPVILLDAADTEMRSLAIRRERQSQYLTTWGAEMIRVHLANCEWLELDTPEIRNLILKASGGIPSETIALIQEMHRSESPKDVAEKWVAKRRVPKELLVGKLGKALEILDMDDGGDFETMDKLMCEYVGLDLVTIGPDLLATGLVSEWKPKQGRIRKSALGDLLCHLIEN